MWWADLQLVIGALDAALSAIVGDEAQKIHDDMASNIRRLVGAIQRANACTAPLSHRMVANNVPRLSTFSSYSSNEHLQVDEALVVLYRFGDAAKAGRLPPLSLQSQTEQLGPSSTAILGIGFLGGLLAIDELISIHVAPGKKYDTDSLAKILHDCGFHDCVKASVLQVALSLPSCLEPKPLQYLAEVEFLTAGDRGVLPFAPHRLPAAEPYQCSVEVGAPSGRTSILNVLAMPTLIVMP